MEIGLIEAVVLTQYQEYHSQKMANNKASSSFWSQIELHILSVLPKKCTKIFCSLCIDASIDKYIWIAF